MHRHLIKAGLFVGTVAAAAGVATPAMASNVRQQVCAFSDNGMHTGCTEFIVSDYGRKSGGLDVSSFTSMSAGGDEASCVARIVDIRRNKIVKRLPTEYSEYANNYTAWDRSVVLKNGTYKVRVVCHIETYYGPEVMVMTSRALRVSR
ncbi:hypothetical protein [Actinoplanes sp. NPDC051859]|uniref:hypothetical protein n=1 Tax=Actinoplanes sp. NPDC051859 TaxID=3363909 RepID=UPI0037AFC234